MTAPLTGAPWTVEPGAIVFLPKEDETGFTDDEIFAILNGQVNLVDGLIAAADVHDGAMIAFVPTTDDLVDLVVSDGEPIEQMHTTVAYLGDNADIPDDIKQEILSQIREVAVRQPIIIGKIFGFSVWNPGSSGECAVADAGGSDLEDAYDSIMELLNDMEFPYPDQHDPWRPHITLKYQSDAVEVLTDELLGKTGMVTYDRIRVAFGGEVHDFPLGNVLTASTVDTAFHMPGKHDQHTHGRGGASPGELGAAARLNSGKRLDPSDPEQARISAGIGAWSGGGNEGARMNFEVQQAVHDPHADTDGAKFTRVVAAAPANAPTLYRGMAGVRLDEIPDVGHVIALGPTSFTRSKKVAEDFSTPEFSDLGRGTMVRMKISKGSRALQVDQEITGKFKGEQEHIGLGKYHITSRKQSRVSVKTKDGRKREVDLIELELTQVDDLVPATFHEGSKRAVIDPGTEGL